MTIYLAYYLAVFIAVFASTVLILRMLIPKLKSMKVGQKILEIGPRWHKNKQDTPFMGGLSFLISITAVCGIAAAVCAITGEADVLPLSFTLLYAFFNGIIGLLDDFTKFRKKRNDGLTPSQKLILQTVFAAAYIAALRFCGAIASTALYIPFVDASVDIGIGYYCFSIVMLLGIVNCSNLTDGVDGLESCVVFVIGVFFAAAAITASLLPQTILAAALSAAALGFLVYNFHPARVFMGDTGSLFFGALCAGAGFLLGNPLLLLPVCIIFVIEGISVIIQVSVFRISGKIRGKGNEIRVFKMTPIHHHFEKCGWGEVKICFVFAAITLLCSLLAWFGLAG